MKMSERIARLRKREIEIAEELELFAEELESGQLVSGNLTDPRYEGYIPRGDVNFGGTPGELRWLATRIREDANT